MSREDLFPPPGVPSHTSTNQWQSFEMRMRRRRAERCVLRAEVALEAGFPEEAREALEEARRLDCSTPDFDALSAAFTPTIPPPVSRSRPVLALTITTALITTGAAGAWLWLAPKQSVPQPSARELARRAPAPDIRLPAPAARIVVDNPVITTEFIRPEIEHPRERFAEKSNDVAPRAQFARLDRAAMELGPVSAGGSTAAAAVEAPIPRSAPADSPAEARAVPPAAPAPIAPADTEAPAMVDERPRVRAALSRYEAGYSSLNVEGVRAVWPGVDARSLARAFDGLASQRISLGPCSIIVAAATARAECQGTFTWTPRIGGGTRTANRAWTFELRNAAGAWQIVGARVR